MTKLVRAADIAIEREVDGLPMGVLSDGTAYLTGRGLAKLCGVAPSRIIEQANRWLAGDRTSKLAQLIIGAGFEPDSLFLEIEHSGSPTGRAHAYQSDICQMFLEYYALDAQGDQDHARQNFRIVARAGLKLFVYRAVGYDPQNFVPKEWRQFHARLTTHTVPFGYFSVFRELTEFMVVCMQRGLPCDDKTVPDISVGQIWARHWVDNNLSSRLGERKRHAHNYPEDFAQSYSNPQDIWIYPLAAVPEFRSWLMTTYVPKKFPKYLKSKASQGALPASTVELILTELTSPELGAGPDTV